MSDHDVDADATAAASDPAIRADVEEEDDDDDAREGAGNQIQLSEAGQFRCCDDGDGVVGLLHGDLEQEVEQQQLQKQQQEVPVKRFEATTEVIVRSIVSALRAVYIAPEIQSGVEYFYLIFFIFI